MINLFRTELSKFTVLKFVTNKVKVDKYVFYSRMKH